MMARKMLFAVTGLAVVAWSSTAQAGEGCAHAHGKKTETASLASDAEGFKDGSAILYGVKLVSE